MSRSGLCVDIRKKRGEKKKTSVREEGVKKAEKSGRGREKNKREGVTTNNMYLTRNRNQCKKKKEGWGRGGERKGLKVSLFSFPLSFVFDGPGLFAY